MATDPPDSSNWKTILTLSAEDTVGWLKGKRKIKGSDFTDPATGVKFDQEKAEIKIGLATAMTRNLDINDDDDLQEIGLLLVDSLPNSKDTRNELKLLVKYGPKEQLRCKIADLTRFALDE